MRYLLNPGDVKWKDVNNDGKIDNYDMVKVGNYNPKWTGGINTSLSWKDLRISARFDYALGFMAVRLENAVDHGQYAGYL